MPVAYVAGAVSAVALVGLIAMGEIILLNSTTGISSSSSSSNSQSLQTTGLEPGMLYGYIKGLGGLPAIGSTVTAKEQTTGQTTSVFLWHSGQYTLDLAPGMYTITITFPNGSTQVAVGYPIDRGTASELNFSY